MMKGTLLVLALLVTHGLGVKIEETCPIFYDVFGAVLSSSKMILNLSLKKVNATEPEKAAMEKIQDCYRENGLLSVVLDTKAMLSITTSKDCIPNVIL